MVYRFPVILGLLLGILLWGSEITLGEQFASAAGAEEALIPVDVEEALIQGKQFSDKGKYHEALPFYESALAWYRAEHNRQGEADVMSDIAVLHRKMGELPKSLKLQRQAAGIYAELGDRPNQTKALRRIGVLYRHQGRLLQAIASLEQALALLEPHEHPEDFAKILTNIGIVYGEMGRLQDARQYFERALDMYTQLQNQGGISYTLGNLGQLFLYFGNSQQALEYLEKSLTIKRVLSDIRGEANTLLNTGTAHRNLGDFQKAFTLYYQALDMYKQLNDQRGQAASLGNIGTTYEELGDLDRAQQYQLQSLQFKRQSGSPVQISIALTNLASLAIKQQRFAEAESYLQEGLKIALDHNSLLSQANIYGQFGLSQLHQEKFQNALKNFSQALELYKEIGSQKGVLEILDFFGQAHIKQDLFLEALPYYERALLLAQKLNDMNSLWMVQYRLGHIHINLGNEHQALTYFQTSITTLEQMRSYLKLPELRRLFMQKNLNPYQEMIRLLLKHGKYEQALLYLERFKARTFLEMAAYGEPQLHSVPELIQEEQYLSARIRFLEGRFSSGFDNSSSPNTLEDISRELELAKEAYEQLLLRIKLQYPEYYRLKIVDADEIQQLIHEAMSLVEDEVVILEYFFDETQLYIWIIEKDQLHYTSVPVAQEAIIDRVLRFRAELTDYESTDIVMPLQDLYSWLVAPVESYLTQKTIVGIVPFHILHFVPFNALICPPQESSGKRTSPFEEGLDTQYFIEKYAIFSLPSLSILSVVRDRGKHHKTTSTARPEFHVLGFGNATEDLPGAEEEIETILTYFPNSKGYTGKEAVKQRLLDEAGNYEILHLAMHGVFDKYHPMFSYLEFSSESYLYAREIFGLQLWAALVTLSGCETFLPQQIQHDDIHTLVSGDELVGFIRAFMYAGAPSVLASLWRVNDIATQYLMSTFYQNLSDVGKVKALQQASQRVIRSTLRIGRREKKELRLSHPFFWSAFVLIGDWK